MRAGEKMNGVAPGQSAPPNLHEFEVRMLRRQLRKHGVQVHARLGPRRTHIHHNGALAEEGVGVRHVAWR